MQDIGEVLELGLPGRAVEGPAGGLLAQADRAGTDAKPRRHLVPCAELLIQFDRLALRLGPPGSLARCVCSKLAPEDLLCVSLVSELAQEISAGCLSGRDRRQVSGEPRLELMARAGRQVSGIDQVADQRDVDISRHVEKFSLEN